MPRKNPAVSIAADLSHQLARLEADLGLTPAARTTLRANVVAEAEDSLDEEYYGPRRIGSGA